MFDQSSTGAGEMAAACHHFKPESPHCQVGPSRVLYLDSETSWLVYLDFKTGQVVDIDFSTSLVVFLAYILKVGISGNQDSANFFHFPPKFRLRT